jgi:hypothetical protein
MPPAKKPLKSPTTPPATADNAIAKNALEAIEQIDRDAKQKKMGQLQSLQTARDDLLERRNELDRQLAQIDKAIAAVTGKPTHPNGEQRIRRNFDDVRDRIGRWMVGRQGQKFGAGDLAREFPELEGTEISYVLKPLVESGKIKTDASEGVKRVKYYAAEG